MEIDLKPFCAWEDGGRFRLDEPWVAGGWRYATNGSIAVRVPAPGEPDTIAEHLAQNPVSWCFATNKFTAGRCTVPFPAHTGKIQKRACDADHRPECPTCDGDGQCTCSDCENTHTCSRCEGSGKNPDYDPHAGCECRGTGTIPEPAPMEVGGKLIAGKYVVLISALPNARYDAEGDPDKVLYFRADGGIEGAVGIIRCSSYR